MAKRGKQAGRLGQLDGHYAKVYGERWTTLREGLVGPTRYVAWVNPRTEVDWPMIRHIPSGCEVSLQEWFPPPTDGSHYILDGASILPALAVAPEKGDRIFDACAAPGGKTLLLADQARRVEATVVANEKSSPRRARLRRVLDDYGAHVQVTGFDAVDKRIHIGDFDRILVDAPCSAERHFLHGKGDWSVSRLKRDAALQLALLRGVLTHLKPGGRLVYSTCSIAPTENDHVVTAILHDKRHPHILSIEDPLADLAFSPHDPVCPLLAGVERTDFGAIALPDRSAFGPLYWAVLTSSGHRR